MDTFNIIVGIFSILSAIIASVSYMQSRKTKLSLADLQNKITVLEQQILSINTGGKIQAGGNIIAGKNISASGFVK